MAIRSQENSVGAWAFLIGVVIAVIIGLSASSFLSFEKLMDYSAQIYAILAILGLIVGFSIKATEKDTQTFLIAGAILVIVSRFGMESVTGSLIGIGVGASIASMFGALLTLFVPATIIVALKTVFSMAKI